MTAPAESLNTLLSRLRTERGLSIAQLAARTGLSPNAVRWIERGVTQPKPESLRVLAQALEVPYELLLQRAGYLEQPLPPQQSDDVGALFRELSPEHQELVMNLMRALAPKPPPPAGESPTTGAPAQP